MVLKKPAKTTVKFLVGRDGRVPNWNDARSKGWLRRHPESFLGIVYDFQCGLVPDLEECLWMHPTDFIDTQGTHVV